MNNLHPAQGELGIVRACSYKQRSRWADIVEVPTLFRSIALETVESLSLSQVVDEEVAGSHGAEVMFRVLEFIVRTADERIGRLERIEQLREALDLEHGHRRMKST